MIWIRNLITKEKLFVALGSVAFLHELIIAEVERPFILTAALALMGFPLVLKQEGKLRSQEKKEE